MKPLEEKFKRALGALRFSKITTLEIMSYEAHQLREAKTVLKDFTKKPSVQNLKWAYAVRSKNGSLDETDFVAQSMPHPADTNRGVLSVTVYIIKHRYDLTRLTQDKQNNPDAEPSSIIQAGTSPTTAPSELIFQRTGVGTALNKCKLLKTKIVAHSNHTVQMSNGCYSSNA